MSKNLQIDLQSLHGVHQWSLTPTFLWWSVYPLQHVYFCHVELKYMLYMSMGTLSQNGFNASISTFIASVHLGFVKASCTLFGMTIVDKWNTKYTYDSDNLWVDTCKYRIFCLDIRIWLAECLWSTKWTSLNGPDLST